MSTETQPAQDSLFDKILKTIGSVIRSVRQLLTGLLSEDKSAADCLQVRIAAIEDDPRTKIQPAFLQSLHDELGEKYRQFRTVLTNVHDITSAWHAGMANECERAIQSFADVRFGNFDDNRKAVQEIQAVIRRLGCKVKDPKSGHPANLVFKRIGNSANGRFVFEYYQDGEKKTGHTCDTLPRLQLVPDKEDEGHIRQFREVHGWKIMEPDAHLGETLDIYAA